MQFVVIGYDGADPEAIERRNSARESHLNYGEMAANTGEQIMAAAMVNQNDNMIGSVMIVDFDTIEDLQAWLNTEAYVTGDVWRDIQVFPCKIAPPFQHLIKRPSN